MVRVESFASACGIGSADFGQQERVVMADGKILAM